MGAPARTLTIAVTEFNLVPIKSSQMLYNFNMLENKVEEKTFILYKKSIKRNVHVEKLSFLRLVLKC